MIIKRLSASFGKLSNETLLLTPGLNVIEAPNECGKSTWCAFIRAMFYGIRTSDRDKQGYLSDKTRYRPWSGAAMAGSMDIEAGGAGITIERVSSGRLPMKDFSAVYTGTGTPVGGLFPDTAGETLFGVSEAVFERSAFISQSGIKIGQTPELEKRISALVSTGDETASLSEADERLRLWLRKRRYNKSGTIPVLEEKLAAAVKRLAAIAAAHDDTADMRLEAERLKKLEAGFAAELKAYDDYEARLAGRRALEKLENAKVGYNTVYAVLTKNGPAPTESDIAAIRGDLKALDSLQNMMRGEQARLQEARAQYLKLQGEKEASPFSGTDAAEAAARAEALDRKAGRLSLRSPLSVSLLLLTIISAAVAALLPSARLIAAGAALVLLAGLLIRLCLSAGARKKLSRYLSGFGAGSLAGLKRLCGDDARLSESLALSEGDVKASEKSAAAAASACDGLLQTLRARLRQLSLSEDLEQLGAALDRIEALHAQLSGAKSELAAAESFLKTVEESGTGNTGEAPAQAPARSRQAILADLTAVSGRLEALSGRYNMALGEIGAMGDPALLGTEKTLAASELAAQQTQYEALTMALDALRDASTELQTRFSPLLADTAGRIIRRLTGGRYEKLTFDKALDALAKTADETVSRNVLALSAGTADQIYLALRLGIVELLLTGGEPCPLILDDALSNFDDGRARLALDYLRELAQERQLLLFTCHGREAAYLGGTGANILKLG
ncbi:AAA domain-containing protein [Sporobacter termitidis DSM 10068]|uniref:AAA domain-containing protein n=1 Tax=Sporobacter termitidis DSM 10068 TaxID=1123282 RepID=A0A1M5Z4U5_9FIRM|nr:AAA family ATPase [Sporobacter termitidis]SHI19128.1 AAA domain-containing protein [Sporobacter termitidis DSM 10068]